MIVLAVALVVAGFVATVVWRGATWWAEGVAIAEVHRGYQVAHPGWSFPARVVTEAVPLTVSGKRRVLEAKARGYEEDCKGAGPGPGEYCGKTEVVVPRQGEVLEPIELGWLVGPDGEVREHLPIGEAPKVLLDAIMAAEDREFREHPGVNVRAAGRAVLANAQEGGYAQGASTLSMQVMKNLSQRKDKTLGRKLQEAVMAVAIDQHLGKEGVLQMYLDAPYLGQDGSFSICGFRAATKYYYGKDVGELSLAEAATLAAILPAPGKFAPDRRPDQAKLKRDRVLDTMQEFFGYDAAKIAEAKASPVEVSQSPLGASRQVEAYPVWLGMTRSWMEQNVPPQVMYGAGLTVTVSMDVAMQEETERLFKTKVPWLEGIIGRRKDRLQAAGLLLDHADGRILAVWGGDDVTSIGFNRATHARRQAGSSFKPVIYAMAFQQPPGPDGKPAYTAASAIPNSPRTFKTPQGNWSPRNNKGEYSVTAAIAYAMAMSQNIATATLMEQLGGPVKLKEFATTLGFDVSRFPDEMGLSLGQGEVTVEEMATFVGEVGNGGRKLEPTPVLRAVDPNGVERVHPPQAGEHVLREEAAVLTREVMRLVVEHGTGGAARGVGGEIGYNGPFAGKTGTADAEKDLWFIGTTPRYAAAVWMGYDQPASLGWAASDLTAPLWGWWVGRLARLDGALPPFDVNLDRRGICRISGKASNGGCPLINAPFYPGTAPKGACTSPHPVRPVEVLEGEEAPVCVQVEGGPPCPAVKKKHESLWKKRARVAEEKAEEKKAAEAPALPPALTPDPVPAPAPLPPAPSP